MELRLVDPKTLLDNPTNPRTSAPDEIADRQLALNIKTVGLIHPPTVREGEDGSLTIIAGHRRRRASVMAKLNPIMVIVTSADASLDDLAAGSENVVRQSMTRPEEWQWVERLRREKKYTDTQISKALCRPLSYLRALSRLANLHPPILHAIQIGLGPDDEVEKLLAMTPVEQQREIWAEIFEDSVQEGEDPAQYYLKSEDTAESVPWTEIGWRLKETRFYASNARFDSGVANAYGVHWEEDLFGEAGKDNRFTTDGKVFEAAQRHWLEHCRPEGTHAMIWGQYHSFEAPEGFRTLSSWQGEMEGDVVGYGGDPRTFTIRDYRLRPATSETAGACVVRDSDSSSGSAPKERADISGTGDTMIGEIRTEALHKALSDAAETVDPWDLVAGLLLAFGGNNVRVQGDNSGGYVNYHRMPTATDHALHTLFPEGVLVRDPALLRTEAIAVIKSVSNCHVSAHSGSGASAQLLGILFDADAQMPNMAFEAFLKTMSKPGITKALEAEGLAPQSTGKAMRSALMSHVGDGRWVPPAAGFAQAGAVWTHKVTREAARIAKALSAQDDDDTASFEDDDDFEGEDAGDIAADADALSQASHQDGDGAGGSASSANVAPDDVAAEEIEQIPDGYDPSAPLAELEKLAAEYRDKMTSTAAGREHFNSHVQFVAV